MYKVILVDDEEEVRNGILKKIDWKEYGFEIAGQAENGKDALDLTEKVIPDVVITDIKMPFMDGIQLSEQIRKKFPSAKIIILTGFDQFEYAQKAIKLDVSEYVLKPVSSKELISVLIKVKNKIDDEIAQRDNVQVLKEHYIKSIPILREKFLASLIQNKLNKNEIQTKARNFGINFEGENYLVSALCIDLNNNYHSEVNCESGLIDDELLNFAVFNIAEEIVNKYKLGIIFRYNEYIIVISSSKEDNGEKLTSQTIAILEEIKMYVEKYLKVAINAGVGDIYNNISDVSISYKNAISALDYRTVIGNNKPICISDVEPVQSNKAVFDELKEQSLVSALKVGTVKEIKAVLDSIFEEFINTKTTYKDYQIYLLEILTTILKVARALAINTNDIFDLNYNFVTEMYCFKEIEDVKHWFTGTCIKISEYISKRRQDTCNSLINEAKDFIQNKYFESDMNIDKVCKHLHISPNYFSTIFKKETKLTFTNYLTQIRMEAAKELLRTTNLKTFEIADKIGYTEPNYFSYCFKKSFNISPSEFRNSTD